MDDITVEQMTKEEFVSEVLSLGWSEDDVADFFENLDPEAGKPAPKTAEEWAEWMKNL